MPRIQRLVQLQWSCGCLPGWSGRIGASVSPSAPSGLSELAVHGARNPSARSVGAEMGGAEQSEMQNCMNELYGNYSDIN